MLRNLITLLGTLHLRAPGGRVGVVWLAERGKKLPEFPTASHYFHDTQNNHWVYVRLPDGTVGAGKPDVTSAPCRHVTIKHRIGNLAGGISKRRSGSSDSRSSSSSGVVVGRNLPLHKVSAMRPVDEHAWDEQRARWDGLFQTITKLASKGSKSRYHPEERRRFTVRECGLAQGFAPRDLNTLNRVIGNPETISKQVGNAVPRELAFAIGCSLVNSS